MMCAALTLRESSFLIRERRCVCAFETVAHTVSKPYEQLFRCAGKRLNQVFDRERKWNTHWWDCIVDHMESSNHLASKQETKLQMVQYYQLKTKLQNFLLLVLLGRTSPVPVPTNIIQVGHLESGQTMLPRSADYQSLLASKIRMDKPCFVKRFASQGSMDPRRRVWCLSNSYLLT